MDDKGAERIKRAAQDALQTGEPEQALDLLAPLLEARRDDTDALAMAGAALLATGDASDALTLLDRALALAPDVPTAHYSRGRALERLGRVEDAARAFSRTLDLEPEHAPAANRLRTLLRGESMPAASASSRMGEKTAGIHANIRRRRVIRRGSSTPDAETAPDELTLRAAAAMAHVVQRLERLVEKVDEVSARESSSAAPTAPSPRATPPFQQAPETPEAGIVPREPDRDAWRQHLRMSDRPDPTLIPSSYGPEMWPAGILEESPLPNLWQLCGATLQLFLLKPLPWVLPLLAAHALAALVGVILPLNPWIELLAWEIAFVCGVAPALLVLTDQWILGGEGPPAPFVTRLLGIGRVVLLIQVVVFTPIAALLALRTGLPVSLLNSLALILSFPLQVLFAPALFVAATEDTSVSGAVRAGISLAPRRARFHLGVMALTLVGGGGLLAGLVYLLSRGFAGAGEGFTVLWWTLGASLGAGLWGAAVIACGGDAVAASELSEGESTPQPAYP